jgi:16S rRNA (cytosine1402-N4)-methyltransferase
LENALESEGVTGVDGIVYDLGVSSNQLDTSAIGLSYRVTSRLDMRLDPRLETTAYEIINEFEETRIKKIFKEFGEESRAGIFARRIVETRAVKPIETTTALADLLSRGIREDKRSAILSRIFQALRIEVNDELGQLEQSLEQAIRLLKPGGRMVVVSYHSLEDRIVKNAFIMASAPKSDPSSPDFMKSSIDLSRASLKLITRKPLVPADEEIARNPRARSAKLRAAEKI